MQEVCQKSLWNCASLISDDQTVLVVMVIFTDVFVVGYCASTGVVEWVHMHYLI